MKSKTSRWWTALFVGAVIQGAVQAVVQMAIARSDKKASGSKR